MTSYQETKRGWDAAAASEQRQAAIHPAGIEVVEYLESGRYDAEVVIKLLRKWQTNQSLVDCSILEYGAGDGRISLSTKHAFRKVYHVDFSYKMLQEAKFKDDLVRFDNEESKMEFVLSNDNLFTIEPADFAYSLSVFIHNNYESGKQIMKSISDNLKAGGLALLQIPIYDVAREPESWTGVGVWTDQMLTDAATESGLEILELNKNNGAFSYKQPGPNHFKYQIMRKTAE